MTILGAMFIASVILTSCGGKSPELSLKKENSISGVLKGYVEIVDKSPYKIEFEESGEGDFYKETPYIVITLKSIKSIEIPSGEENSIQLDVDLIDDNDGPVQPSLFGSIPRDLDAIESHLKSGSREKSFKLYGYNSGKTSSDFFKDKDVSKAKFISLNSTWNHVVGR